MADDLKQSLAEIDRQLQQKHQAGDRLGEIKLRGQKAVLYSILQDWAGAVREIEQVAIAAAADGQVYEEGQARLALGKALVNISGRQRVARKAFHRAATLFQAADSLPHEVEARRQVIDLDIANGDYPTAIAELTEAIARLGTHNPHQTAQLYSLRSNCYLLQKQIELAHADLTQALSVAEGTDDRELVLQLQVQQQGLTSLTSGTLSPKQLTGLLEDAQATGNLQVIGGLQLQQANALMQAGQFTEAAEQAEAARQAALQATDLGKFMRCLAASLMLAEIREHQGDRPGVLAILLGCKAYLEANLGREVGEYMNRLLDSVGDRWGRDELTVAIQTYQQHIREHGPQVW